MSEHDTSGPSSPSADQPIEKPELGHLATWTVSTHKYGFGVENLKDNNDGTFWQSEGPQPHIIDLSFPKRVMISSISLQTSHPRDDSYTPSKIAIKAGTGLHDLQEVRSMEFEKPNGWIPISLRPMEVSETEAEIDGPPIPCHHLRLLIIANHLNGKDTHVRGLKVFGVPGLNSISNQNQNPASPAPSESEDKIDGRKLLELGHDGLSGFTSPQFKMHEGIR
ncbi:anaphase-promoting complex subunit 10, partial [Tremellales sp. Uapishka_1]